MSKDRLDLAYYAGLFDGEGCVDINRHKPQTGKQAVQHTLRCHVGMTDEMPIRGYKKIFGGNIHLNPKSKKNPKWSDIWIWTIESNQAKCFLEILVPFLRIKKDQAKVAIEFQQIRQGQHGRRLPIGELERRDKYYKLLSRMKGKNGRLL